MDSLSLLMISQDAALVNAMQGVARSLNGVRLQTSPSLEESLVHQQHDLGLIVIQLTRQHTEARVVDFLQSLNGSRRACPVLLISDEYQSDQAVTFLRAGAAEYCGPIQDLAKLSYLVDVLTMFARQERCADEARATGHGAPMDVRSLILMSEMVSMMDQLRLVIPQETSLLLMGETGTGKTRLARLIHELSPRREEPFVVVDCGSLSASLIESEMFGHVRGAFTGADRDHLGKFAAAGRGTLLLDEINSLPLHLQSKLLRAVDDRMFEPVGSTKSVPLRARVIAAANVQLEDEVAAGRFRADLFYRLNVVGFYLPPLRERRGSIVPLANKFLATFAERNHRDICRITPEALQILTDYDWPGNIRELRNVIERAVALAPGPDVKLSDLPEKICLPARPKDVLEAALPFASPAEVVSLAKTKEEAEVLRIRQALNKHGNNRLRAAAELGISRMGLYKKLHKYGLMESR